MSVGGSTVRAKGCHLIFLPQHVLLQSEKLHSACGTLSSASIHYLGCNSISFFFLKGSAVERSVNAWNGAFEYSLTWIDTAWVLHIVKFTDLGWYLLWYSVFLELFLTPSKPDSQLCTPAPNGNRRNDTDWQTNVRLYCCLKMILQSFIEQHIAELQAGAVANLHCIQASHMQTVTAGTETSHEGDVQHSQQVTISSHLSVQKWLLHRWENMSFYPSPLISPKSFDTHAAN